MNLIEIILATILISLEILFNIGCFILQTERYEHEKKGGSRYEV